MLQIVTAVAMTEHMAQTQRDSEEAQHAATLRALRKAERDAPQPLPRRKIYLDFLPRLLSFPPGR
jgi:hypothetical protein